MSVIDDHAQAFLTRLAASGSPALTVLDGANPDNVPPPYVLVYFAVATPSGEQAPDKVDLTFDSDVVEMSAYCHFVGGNAAAARALAGRGRTALLNFRPTVTGRVCLPIRHVDNLQPDRDEATGSLVVDLVDVYSLTSVPA